MTWQGGQEVYAPSTYGWPCFMRVNPILDWTYRYTTNLYAHTIWVNALCPSIPYNVPRVILNIKAMLTMSIAKLIHEKSHEF